MTTFLKVKNRAVSTLTSGINDTVTSLDVTSGEGTLFPSTYPFHITIENEILSCTTRSTDTLTVVRAQQGTSGAAHSSGVAVSLNITAKNVSDLNTAVNAIENQVAYGRLDGWIADKLLKGAGAGVDPTEIDVPSAGAVLTVTETEVFNATSPTSWTDLDLSGTIGANVALVLLKIKGDATMVFVVRKNGDGDEFYGSTGDAMGVALGKAYASVYIALICATDATGKIEWRSAPAGTTTIDIIAYIK